VRETEENNIKCSIFNEKWLIFLFVTADRRAMYIHSLTRPSLFWWGEQISSYGGKRKTSLDYSHASAHFTFLWVLSTKISLLTNRFFLLSLHRYCWCAWWSTIKRKRTKKTSCTLIDLYLMYNYTHKKNRPPNWFRSSNCLIFLLLQMFDQRATSPLFTNK
jgi:hypothetical protein